MLKLKKVNLFILLLACLFLIACASASSTNHGDVENSQARSGDKKIDGAMTEKNFIQSKYLGNCCLIAGMATLPGNAELRNKVVPPSGQNSGNEREFNIYKLGKLHRVVADVDSLPRRNGTELVFSTSANDDMVGPLLEKAYVDLHFDGDYWSSDSVYPITVFTSLTNNYTEEFRNVSVDLPFEISEVVNHGLKTNSPMLVQFRGKPGELQGHHCYTLLGLQDGHVEVYNPHGRHLRMSESDFYANLEGLFVSYFKNQIFRMPRVETSVEFSETWPAVDPREKIHLMDYDLVVDEDDTEVFINLVTRHDTRYTAMVPKIFITTGVGSESRRVIKASAFHHVDKSGKKFYYFTYSLRENLNSGRYKLVVTLSSYSNLRNCRSCSEHLEKFGDKFLFRLAASKHSSVSKSVIKETEKVEQMLTDWERDLHSSF